MAEEPNQNDQPTPGPAPNSQPAALSKSAQKKLARQQRQAARKAEKKAQEKERKRKDFERRRKEWDDKLRSAASEEERAKMIEERKETRRERMGMRAEERGVRAERLRRAEKIGEKLLIDLEFVELMTASEIHSLVQQIMYCYAVNGRCASPAHIWLTGCGGEMETQLQRIPGFNKWIIEKEDKSYIEALEDQKENLVYLTADAETILDDLDPMKIYIIGGLVDRNRWKGITMKKANDRGIQSARLPIGSYLKMSSSQVIPERKRGGDEDDAETEEAGDEDAQDLAKIVSADEDGLEAQDAEEVEEEEDIDGYVDKKQRIRQAEDATRKVAEADAVEDFEGVGEKECIKEATNGMKKESQLNEIMIQII